MDLRDLGATVALLREVRPEVVVHTAYRQDDWATTAGGAAHVALACADSGARLVHVSSDVVFRGDRDRYTEDDEPDAVAPYGRAKAAAEQAVLECAPGAAVVRTSLVLGLSGGRRSPTEQLVHALATGAREGALFTDDVKCPVHVDDLADALLEVVARGLAGVLHAVGPDAVSRHELGLLVAARDGLDPARLPTTTRAAAGVDGAARLVLDATRTQAVLQTRLRGAREFLAQR
ncbi:sugar nucleotide-binding protein [Phycicoccus ginsengisoli]